MTLPVARELARYGIRIVTIAPGLLLTPLLAWLPQGAQGSLGRQVPFSSWLDSPMSSRGWWRRSSPSRC